MTLVKYQKSREWVARNESPKLIASKKDEFAMVVLKICATIGIRESNMPKGLIFDNLYNFCIENLKSYTLKEFELAFNYYASCKLDFGSDHFQDLNPVFVSKVMQSYIRYLFSINAKITKEETPAEAVDKKISIKDAKKTFINMIIEDIKSNSVNIISVSVFYDLLCELNLIKVYNDSKSKLKVYNEAKKEYINSILKKSNSFKNKEQKEDFKIFTKVDNYFKGYHHEKVLSLIKYKAYKNFVNTNKNSNLEELEKTMTKKLNELQPNSQNLHK